MRHRIKFLGWVAIASIVLLELVLQGAALAAHLMSSEQSAPGTADVLCIGDSYTYGDGASAADRSYPAVLERLLAERGVEARVANVGVRGQDSRDVLGALGEQLRRFGPEVVCVLVGCNDLWNRPDLLDDAIDAGGGSFKLRWRTGRLIRWLTQSTGSWLEQAQPRSAPEPARAGPSQPMLEVAERVLLATGIERMPTAWRPQPAPAASREALRDARAAIAGKDLERARSRLEEALETGDCPELRALLVRVCVLRGEPDAAEPHFEALARQRAADSRGDAALHELRALWSAGKTDLGVSSGERLVAERPEIAEAWLLLARAAWRRDRGVAAAAYEQYVARSRDELPAIHVEVASLGRAVADLDATRGARLLATAALLQGSIDGPVRARILTSRPKIPAEIMGGVLHAIAEDPALDDRGRALLLQLFEEAYGNPQNQHLAVLAKHLKRVVELSRSHGAEPVVLTYPMGTQARPVQIEVSRATDCPLVDVSSRFQRELRERDRSQIFAADGHCNDAGYAIVAEELVDVVAELLRR